MSLSKPNPSWPCPARASEPRNAPASSVAGNLRHKDGFVFPADRSQRLTASMTANKNRSSQAKPNCVRERTIQIVPSATTSSIGLLAIRADNRQSHAKPERIDKTRLIHKILAVRVLNMAPAAPRPKSAVRKAGEATNKSKKTMPATITDETK